jgi:transposase-like protein
MASQAGPSRRRRRLTAPEKYQLFLEFISRDGSQREIARRWRVDRATVLKVVAVAKQSALEGLARSRPGRPGRTQTERELEDAQAEIARLTETVKEQAVELMLLRGKGPWD